MAYNQQSITNAKKLLEGLLTGTNKSDAAEKASKYYEWLKKVKNNRQATPATSITQPNQTANKTPTRNYLYSLGETKGMTQSDVDKLIGWNGKTGEVSFDGKNLGKPDTIVNGVSYWNNTSALDNAFNSYINKMSKTGKTPTRDYLYSLGKSKGMTSGEVDKLISWDNQTGEVSFGGKKIGKPDTVVDGVSYWSDTSALDNAFNDYISRSGTSRTNSAAISQENDNLFNKYNQEYEDLKDTNPFETETSKAILAKYDLAGLQGRDNETAKIAGSNGGNIDSFAAANALRQQSSLINQGQMAALEAYQQRLDHARALLSDMGVNIDRVFNQEETSKNNDVARKSEIAGVTGLVPEDWSLASNPYMNSDGTIKDQYKNVDFAAVMKKAKEAGNTSAYNAAAAARYYKIMGNYGAYGKYDDGNYMLPGAAPTEAARQFNENIAAGDRQLNAQVETADKDRASNEKMHTEDNNTKIQLNNDSNAAAVKMNADDNSTTLKVTQDNNDSAERITDSNNASAERMQAAGLKAEGENNTEYNVTVPSYNSPSPSSGGSSSGSGSSGGGTTAKPTLTASQALAAIKNGERSQTVIDAYNYYYGTSYTTDDPPKVSNNTTNNNASTNTKTLTNAEVDKWVKKLNDYVVSLYDKGNNVVVVEKAVKKDKDGTYKTTGRWYEQVIYRVTASNELTDDQKWYLLGKFGISKESALRALEVMIKDPRYK